MSVDVSLEQLKQLLQQEHQARVINCLIDLEHAQDRRKEIHQHWQTIQEILSPVQREIAGFLALPPEEHIQWAQTVLALPNLAFMEIDTTGLKDTDEIIRFTLIDRDGCLIEDVLMRPTARQLNLEVSQINGITPEQLAHDGIPIAHELRNEVVTSSE
jgi:hypothetical protein